MENSGIEKLLEGILQEVSLLTVPTKATALQKFKKEFLNSEIRAKAYEKFDGVKTIKQISEEIGAKANTIQIFVAQLIANDLVNVSKQGNNQLISKSITKIAVYYANKELSKENSDGQ